MMAKTAIKILVMDESRKREGWLGKRLECRPCTTGPEAPPGRRFYTDLTACHMDIIFIEELRISTMIGIYPREKAMPQTVEMSLQIGTSTARAGSSDEIDDTISYALVVDRLRAELAARQRPCSKTCRIRRDGRA